MKISIVTVCLNAEQYLEQQLASVASQSWRDLEQIVVDGGSTDRTLEIVQRAAQDEPRLRWTSGPDGGIGDAMNKGLALATGDVVGFLHADDFFADPSVLHKVADAFDDPATEWVTGGIRYVDSRGEVVAAYAPRRWSYRRLLRGNILFHPATFVRRDVLQAVGGFDPALRYTMDYDLWLRLGRRCAPRRLDLPVACFRVHPHSTSVRHIDAAFREEFQVRCRYLRGKPVQRVLHLVYFALKFLPNRWSVRHGAAS
ncbi:glycosyltransferase family 2 protein [Geomonas anaerohicana]|uniref:Glycosyltransferase n=1 Tax=Geomonas anaerohicana TaxID=2798583 RepID=A0ABS0YGJ1_9BACT|nr:glycosyltransferase family 2 protein [Geomonas anaerohicana]MBJ6751448.1 glycosyltransferase [Geomonas anaerohicana]